MKKEFHFLKFYAHSLIELKDYFALFNQEGKWYLEFNSVENYEKFKFFVEQKIEIQSLFADGIKFNEEKGQINLLKELFNGQKIMFTKLSIDDDRDRSFRLEIEKSEKKLGKFGVPKE
ncbi:hypothetical protein [Macrococcus brunensis]|uniref:hypothetical protein n=1 Tax=Macrococcus brunensis TaxID=198483 RepID=UPI001EEFA1A0|nr:hypothetical protein [Macrococcus brunensis]ULG73013.1 hypothetical protein MGG12_05720 [Macrococcus brunensis]